ncbi:hypothetical protein E2562_034500 [Oryza meyeriana var. granulata]|uniref:Uncharacterized protein n=1 Tax=Oryza meyeriana var. granulata TaxID=110450 RepID=A0A6G1CUW9_9ORYZ|nr:hypothetical protein E2562_034500 [Oryza meyeriana var. granulata]
MKLKDRRRIAIQIRDLKSRVEEVSNRNTRYSLISSNTDEHDTFTDDFRNFSAKNIDEAGLVGFDDPKENLLKLIDIHANHENEQLRDLQAMQRNEKVEDLMDDLKQSLKEERREFRIHD